MPSSKNSPETVLAYIGLGANLSDRAAALTSAVRALDAVEAITVAATSPVYETAAHTLTPGDQQPSYLNAVAAVHTTLSARALLDACLRIERTAGRDRVTERRWASRPLDLDVLLYGEATVAFPALTVPHPRLADRRFVLVPLADLAAERSVPAPFNATVADLLARCPDPDLPVRTPLTLPFSVEP